MDINDLKLLRYMVELKLDHVDEYDTEEFDHNRTEVKYRYHDGFLERIVKEEVL